MSSSGLLNRLVPLAGGCLLLTLGAALWAENMQSPPSVRAERPMPQFVGFDKCESCHKTPGGEFERKKVTDFLELKESHKWLAEDKHAHAFDLIDPQKSESPLARQMADRLGIADIHQETSCLSCHADWQYDGQEQKWLQRPSTYERGVACESCHGAASQWFLAHTDSTWRKRTPEDKAALGMVDVRDPQTRAKQCLACHVGDPAQRKFVTHKMYAAGHPPLPSIELETFVESMPPHWVPAQEKLKKNFEFKMEFLAANPNAIAGGKLHRSRSALIGAIVAMQTALKTSAPSGRSSEGLPDFAQFDCYACHHDLKSPAWRQKKPTAIAPGRPLPASWPTALIEPAYAFANEDPAPWRAALAEYYAAYGKRPFGDPVAVASSTEKLERLLRTLLAQIEATLTDQQAVERALAALVNPLPTQSIDYDSARQIAWCLAVFTKDLNLPPERASNIQAVFDGWRESLRLPLPSKQSSHILDDLPVRMQRLNGFDPEAFRAKLKQLAEFLP